MKNWDLPRWLLFLICFGALPHIIRIPIWNTALSSGFLLWYYLHIRGIVNKPNRALRVAFAFLCLGGILFTYRTILGLDAGLAFIVQISCLKLFEIEEMRDSILIVWLSSLLIIGEILYEQNLLVTVWFIVGLAFIARVMGKIYQWENAPLNERDTQGHWRFSWRAATQVIPLAMILFFVFPRINFSLWGAFSAGMSGQIGFSEELRPGDVAKIAGTNQVAFRARIIEGEMPRPEEMYWRGMVLSATDGRSWLHTRRDEVPQSDRQPAVAESEKSNYVLHEITLEPHQRKWLFALDTPDWLEFRGGFKSGFRRYGANEYYANRQIQGRMNYVVLSKTQKKGEGQPQLTEVQRKRELQMPPRFDSPLEDLAKEIRLVSDNDEDYIRRVLNYFRDNGFTYTLSPGVLKTGRISEFVFQTKQGFCEHFASATALLLRLGGVPARVVAGFQGGKINPYGNYLIVGYRDAHSWVEAWIDGKGWTRVDPTAVVAPGRLTLGGQDFVDRFGIDPDLVRNLAQIPEEEGWTWRRIVAEIIFLWDSVNDSWNNALISYDRDMQREILSRVSWRYPIWMQLLALGLAGFVVIGLLLVFYYHFRRRPQDEIFAIYQRVLRRLAKRGVQRRFAEGPIDLLERARNSQDLKISVDALEEVIDDYIDLRFGKKPATSENLQEFRRKARIVA